MSKVRILHFKYVKLMVCQSYLNKTVPKKKRLKTYLWMEAWVEIQANDSSM